VFSTYPQGFTGLGHECITFDLVLDPTLKYQTLSLDNVKALEDAVSRHGFISLKLSLAFMYANLELYGKAVALLDDINSRVGGSLGSVTGSWAHRVRLVHSLYMRKVGDIVVPEESNGIRLFIEYVCEEEVDITRQIRRDWTLLITNTSIANVPSMYTRLCDISSNEVEGVLKLSNHSTSLIVRNGIATGAIESTQDGEYRDPDSIANILRDTVAASSMINRFCHGNESISHEFILKLHEVLVDTFRMRKREVRGLIPRVEHYLIDAGSYRDHQVGSGTIVYSDYRRLSELMDTFLLQANQVLEGVRARETLRREGPEFFNCYYDYDGAYTLAAKLHYVLIRIHPFSDGNGRTTRILSSIPLLMCGLPPICISDEHKPFYYDALRTADRTDNLTDLVKVLQQGSILSTDRMTGILKESTDNDRVYMYNVVDVASRPLHL
jgi:hypothetical protein